MKNRAGRISVRKAALAAAFFIGALSAMAAEEKSGLKPADARVQRLFDQAVKLHRRHAANPKTPVEPFKSFLTELALYHEDETATYLSDMGAEGTRSPAIHFAPWALHRLALLDVKGASYQEAITHFHELGERFPGTKVIEPADGPLASVEATEAASLRGEIEAFLLFARQEGTAEVAEALEERIEWLHEKFGSEALPGHESRGSYSELALDSLWKALTLDKADFKTWQKATNRFVKKEKSGAFKKAILETQAEACLKLGKKAEAEKFLDQARAWPASDAKKPQGAYGNLLPEN